MKPLTEDIPEAPWRFVQHAVTIEGRKYYVCYVGKEAREMIENAVCTQNCDLFRNSMQRSINELRIKLKVLTDIAGPKVMVEYFKGQLLLQIGQRSWRTGDLASYPYSRLKHDALQELLNEGKVIHTRNGWWKLEV